MKKFFVLSLSLLMVFAIVAGAMAADDVIKVGLFGPLTGPSAMNGLAMVQGAELAIAQINADGGLLGKQIELITYDDQANVEQAVKNVTRLCEVDDVDVILATVISTNILATHEIVYDHQTPTLGLGTSPTWLQGEHKDYLFRVLPSNVLTNAALIDAISDLELTKIGILYRADEAGTTNKNTITALCEEAGVEVVTAEAFQPDDTDVSGQLNKLVKSGIEGLVCFGTTTDPIMILNQLKMTDYDGFVFGPEIFSPFAVKEATGDASEGVIYAAPYALPQTVEEANSEDEKAFLTAFVEHFGKMPESDVAYRTYDAMQLYKLAVEETGSIEGSVVRDALDNIDDYVGLAGQFQYKTAAEMGEHGEGIRSCRLYVIENSKDVLFDEAKVAEIKAGK